MRGSKQDQYLVFEFDNGKNVKYDLANHIYIGKLGKPVKSFKNQFKETKIEELLESMEDDCYKAFLSHIYKKERVYSIQELFEKIKACSKLEPLFQSGIKEIEHYFPYTIKEVPKSLLKLAKTKQFSLGSNIVREYKENQQIVEKLFNASFNAITTEQISNLFRNHNYPFTSFITLIKEYRYDTLSLIRYLDNVTTYEGLEDINDLIRKLCDYANKMSVLTNNDYNKYPKNFLTQHQITKRNYTRFSKEFPEELFQARYNKKFEFEFENFSCVCPKDTKAIQREGADLNHCVASYIDRVLNGDGQIIFLRHSDKLEESLITLYIVNGELTTALGKHNRQPNEQEEIIIETYKEYLATL